MAEENEKSGSGIGGIALGGIAGAGAGFGMLKHEEGRLLKGALTDIDALSKQEGMKKVGEKFLAGAKDIIADTGVDNLFKDTAAALKPAEGVAKLEGEALKAAKKANSELVKGFTETLKAEKIGIVQGMTTTQKGKILAVALAGVAAGVFTANAIFGGKYTSKVSAEREAPAQGRSA